MEEFQYFSRFSSKFSVISLKWLWSTFELKPATLKSSIWTNVYLFCKSPKINRTFCPLQQFRRCCIVQSLDTKQKVRGLLFLQVSHHFSSIFIKITKFKDFCRFSRCTIIFSKFFRSSGNHGIFQKLISELSHYSSKLGGEKYLSQQATVCIHNTLISGLFLWRGMGFHTQPKKSGFEKKLPFEKTKRTIMISTHHWNQVQYVST